MSGCRIARVKMKDGADVHILPTKEFTNRESIFRRALEILNEHKATCAGFFIVTKEDCFWGVSYDEVCEAVGGAEYLREKIVRDWLG